MDGRQTQVVKALFRMAWADGEASDEEVEVLSRLMERMGLPLSERLAVMDAHLSDPDLAQGELEAVLPDRGSRLEAMELLITVCFCDQQLAPQEMDLLAAMALRLGMDADDLEYLRHRAMRNLSGH